MSIDIAVIAPERSSPSSGTDARVSSGLAVGPGSARGAVPVDEFAAGGVLLERFVRTNRSSVVACRSGHDSGLIAVRRDATRRSGGATSGSCHGLRA